ncbi:DUF4159 domain-containing protein [Swaminathania salitolerans]|uniref:RNA-binding protein n=1 Tax=Swaminathania salitolerans TaxID=182838 RepID=A0A511BS14_9PROT|nr:DUF4159 domain-containing protein [Swaminathania salitolerans]GBQ14538.1 hypothetical protein AA21291_1883 [Swaminathania salitolerans LMG 21291]GEL03075.1 RNA-binding protein [Swaminathania salitolerans]
MIFLTPLALLGLLSLPILYWLVKATPPPARKTRFPSLRILRLLTPERQDTSRAPLWLLLMRLAAVFLLVLGLAQPVWTGMRQTAGREGDLLLALDNGWAAIPHWQERIRSARALAEHSLRAGHSVTLLLGAPDADGTMPPPFRTRDRRRLEERLLALAPHSWPVDRARLAAQIASLMSPDGSSGNRSGTRPGEIVFLSDGVATAADGNLLAVLKRTQIPVGDMRWNGCDTALLGVARGDGADDALRASFETLACREPGRRYRIRVRDAEGGTLGMYPLPGADDGSGTRSASLPLPPLLRNRAARFVLENGTGALPGPSAIVLADSSDRRHPVGLLTQGNQDTPLTGQGFFLAQAIKGVAELHRGSPDTLLDGKLSVLVATDGALSSPGIRAKIAAWVRKGGILVRFAGPVLAASSENAAGDPGQTLLPVPLMEGMRQLGGPMSWGKPQQLDAFDARSPFAGLAVPDEVTVKRQVLARPTPTLGDHVWARLKDGTPLVTATSLGQGELVLFHVTGTADWSSLPLSGLFPSMLERLIARSLGQKDTSAVTRLAPFAMLDAQGLLVPPPEAARPLSTAALATVAPGVQHPPGLYGPPLARRALNLGGASRRLRPEATLGRSLAPGGLSAEIPLAPWLLSFAIALFLIDFLIALWLRGLFVRAAIVLLAAGLALPCARAQDAGEDGPQAQDAQSTHAPSAHTPADVPGAALETRLGYVLTGHDDIDAASREGLQGLSNYASDRSSAAMGHPDGVTPGKDDLAFYPLIYWPVTEDVQEDPARSAALNAFMAHGGILMLDTQGVGSELSAQDEGQMRAALKRATAGLNVPPLTKLDDHHVLAHSFYLLHDFPGRVQGLPVWVARSGDDSNDDVSPIIIGAGDWAHAWAMDSQGNTPYAVIPGGEDQRVQAYRFGVNVLLYALTGNYKADQMRVPELLKRMKQ